MNTNRSALKSLVIAAGFAYGALSLGTAAGAATASATPTTQTPAANVSAPAAARAVRKPATKSQVAITAAAPARPHVRPADAGRTTDGLDDFERYMEFRHLGTSW